MSERLSEFYEYGEGRTFEDLYPDYKQIAFVDESQPYEVDQTMIAYNDRDNTYILATASGCSCWEGDWGAARYDSLEELFGDLGEEELTYHPTGEGVKALRKQVVEALVVTD